MPKTIDDAKVLEMFEQFREKESTRRVFYTEGVENFYKAIGVDISKDMIFWYISMQMDAKKYVEYLETEFN